MNVRPSIPPASHPNGLSCRNPAAVKYDANGWKTWCVDCGEPLNHLKDTSGVSSFNKATLVILIASLVALMFLLAMGAFWPVSSDIGVPQVTPNTYGPPTVVHSIP